MEITHGRAHDSWSGQLPAATEGSSEPPIHIHPSDARRDAAAQGAREHELKTMTTARGTMGFLCRMPAAALLVLSVAASLSCQKAGGGTTCHA